MIGSRKKIFVFFSILVVLVSLSSNLAIAATYKIKLLAVAELQGNFTGKMADLFLELNPGSGRVFIDTVPLTKIDTQISTRFANQIACNYIDADCTKYDFIYTIRADSSIIGGPSAGAAISVLTIAALKNLELREDIAMTGTINSGGIIGPVGGVKQKIQAAAKNKIKKVLIAKGATSYKDEKENIFDVNEDIGIIIEAPENKTINQNLTEKANITIDDKSDNANASKVLDLKDTAKELNIEIVEVATLDDALFEFTGKRFSPDFGSIVIDESYSATMKDIADNICGRSRELFEKVSSYENVTNLSQKKLEFAKNLTLNAFDAFDNQSYYAAASYCFGANVQFAQLLNKMRNTSKDAALEQVKVIEDSIKALWQRVDKSKKNTMTNLQAGIIVKERLTEAREILENTRTSIADNKSDYPDLLALSIERVYSAVSWSQFLNKQSKADKVFEINGDRIKKACEQKISEAEERITYISLIFPQLLGNSLEDLDIAKQQNADKNYDQCLQRASLAKAEADAVLSVIGVAQEHFDSLVDNRIIVAKNQIVRSANKGAFPILGYSYFEYANNLREQDKYSALIYLQYALELSDLSIYFPQSKENAANNISAYYNLMKQDIMEYNLRYTYLVAGILIGALAGIIITLAFTRKNTITKTGNKKKRN